MRVPGAGTVVSGCPRESAWRWTPCGRTRSAPRSPFSAWPSASWSSSRWRRRSPASTAASRRCSSLPDPRPSSSTLFLQAASTSPTARTRCLRGGGMPWITADEAEMIRRLPAVRDVNLGEDTNGPVGFGSVNLASVAIAGFSPTWIPGERRGHRRRPEFHAARVRRGRPCGGHQRQARRGALPGTRSDRQADQDLRRAVHGGRALRRGRVHVRRLRTSHA